MLESMFLNGEELNTSVDFRKDWLFPYYHTIISEKRAQRPMTRPMQERDELRDAEEKDNCVFEPKNLHRTPHPHREFEELQHDNNTPGSCPNLYPYAVLGRVNNFAAHEHKYAERLTLKDWESYLSMSVQNARSVFEKGYSEMFNMVNFRPLAGGTQPHPHFQDGVLIEELPTIQKYEQVCVENFSRMYSDPFEVYFEDWRKKGLICHETDHVLVAAPYAPRAPDQIDVFVKKDCSGFLSMKGIQRDHLAQGIYRSVHFLATERNVTDFNLAAHQDLLGVQSKYLLHFHIMPRNKNIYAGLEFGFGAYVIDIKPEETAKEFKAYLAELSKK